MLAENFNLWLQNPKVKGILSLKNKRLHSVPPFLPGLHFDCIGLDLQYNDLTQLTNIQGLTRVTNINASHNQLRYEK